jgi:rare lipoprotein A
MNRLFIFILVVVFIIAGCESPSQRDTDGLRDIIPTKEKDRGPDRPVDVSHVGDAIPKYEVRTIVGNKSPYKVKGIVYRVMSDAKGYEEAGIASWYGKKFHGNKTSNGEVYDMYAMTGAHKTLPIPSYVRVENLENKKSIVVRINDRGPFAPGRIIDLSYAGAKKLGYLDAGTARVRVTYIDVPKPTQAASTESVGRQSNRPTVENTQLYIQVGAFSSYQTALDEQAKVDRIASWPTLVDSNLIADSAPVHRVQVGPLPDMEAFETLRQRLLSNGFGEPVRVFKPL